MFFSWNDAPRDLPQVRSETPTRRALRRAVAETVGKLSCLYYVYVVKFVVDCIVNVVNFELFVDVKLLCLFCIIVVKVIFDVDCIVNVVKFEFIVDVKLLCLFCVIVVKFIGDVGKLLVLCRLR